MNDVGRIFRCGAPGPLVCLNNGGVTTSGLRRLFRAVPTERPALPSGLRSSKTRPTNAPATPSAGRVRRARAITVIVATVCLLAGLYAVFRSNLREQLDPPQTRTYRLRIEGQRLASGPARLQAIQGDTIALTVTSDRAGTLHVHEYEQHIVIDLLPGREATSSFTADRAGRFGVHLIGADGSHAEVAAVEVSPR